MRWIALFLIFCCTLSLSAQETTRYFAFGDSITWGEGDSEAAEGDRGYPPRLENALTDAGETILVINAGVGGEQTPEGVSRLRDVLIGADKLLLMEGTNDITKEISRETTLFNLSKMANIANRRGAKTVHVTLIPRVPRALVDPENILNLRINQEIRNMAGANGRGLVDGYETFRALGPARFSEYYWDNTLDPVGHPNGDGYDVLSTAFFDFLTENDTVPPVVGVTNPLPGAEGVSATVAIDVRLWDFLSSIDLANTELLINEEAVVAVVSGSGGGGQLKYTPATPLSGVVKLGLRSGDQVDPANTVDRTVMSFVVTGTTLSTADVNRDGRVDGLDLLLFAPHFGFKPNTRGWDDLYDFNGDNIVDGADLAILAADFGSSV